MVVRTHASVMVEPKIHKGPDLERARAKGKRLGEHRSAAPIARSSAWCSMPG
jgi:hypothetical protein